ncbi:MAG: hypothetical protein H6710_04195 [Myxococcales bacterium]|nr:hypothetical protein [Myxococcales bacterium]MCB9705738.1 hypothetical protein [Myxococcales bacterium]
MRDPVVAPRRGPAFGAALALCAATASAACDADNIQDRLQEILKNQASRADRQTSRETQKAKGGRQGLPPPIVHALDLVAASDAQFIVKKAQGKERTYSGHDFAAMLTSKTIWLGRGIDDLPTWITEIGAGSFMSGEVYTVRRPDGETEPFRPWIERQIVSRPPPPSPPPEGGAANSGAKP